MENFENPQNTPKNNPDNPERREFIKIAGLVGLGAYFGKTPEVSAENRRERLTRLTNNIDNLIFENKENLDMSEKMRKLCDLWEEYFQETKMIENAYKRLKPHEDKLSKKFKQNNLPENLIYTPIIESGAIAFDENGEPLKSSAGAKGAWQIMPSNIPEGKTAKDIATIDDGAGLAIQIFRDKQRQISEKETESNTELLMVAGYNGSFLGRLEETGKEVNMENFLAFMDDPEIKKQMPAGVFENLCHMAKHTAMIRILGKNAPEFGKSEEELAKEAKEKEKQERQDFVKEAEDRENYSDEVIDFMMEAKKNDPKKWTEIKDMEESQTKIFFERNINQMIDKENRKI